MVQRCGTMPLLASDIGPSNSILGSMAIGHAADQRRRFLMRLEMANDSGIRDNWLRGSVGEFLQARIRDGSELSFVSAFFTIYAFEALRDQLGTIDHMNFLFG